MKRILFAILSMAVTSTTLTAIDIKSSSPKIDENRLNDETCLYADPGAPLQMKFGDDHPSLPEWHFFTAHEFLERDTVEGLPKGFIAHNTQLLNRTAKVDNKKCSGIEDGCLKIWAVQEPGYVKTDFGKRVKYSHGAYRSSPSKSPDSWLLATENMRIEVRFKRSDVKGFNHALWFMGNHGSWPACGEIDLLENPKRVINHKAHFTLHSANHYASAGGTGSITSSVVLKDMKNWNIYWVEILSDTIKGGVNGMQFFQHVKGDKGNKDWPWNDPEGFFMLITTGISNRGNLWTGSIAPEEWDVNNPPSMWVDWIRVYVNDKYSGPEPTNHYY